MYLHAYQMTFKHPVSGQSTLVVAPQPPAFETYSNIMHPLAPSQVDLVSFDWDGTIVDSTGAIADSIRAAARDLELGGAQCATGFPCDRLGAPGCPPSCCAVITARTPSRICGALSGTLFRSRSTAQALRRDARTARRPAESGIAMGVALENRAWALNAPLIRLGCANTLMRRVAPMRGEPKPHPWMLVDLCENLLRALAHSDDWRYHPRSRDGPVCRRLFGGVGYGLTPRNPAGGRRGSGS